jgi:demethylmenaquinone methyltransferase/2-methoxy-6-polyprenyl-1,4-benzoquinol methylase
MFGAIAPRYDLLNRLLSASVDRRWRRQVVRRIASLAPEPGDRCLDLCTGTGDLALEIARSLGLETIGSDFCHPMLVESVRKIARRREHRIRTAEADAQELPFADRRFRFVTVAFGIRNVESLGRALGEMFRVLEPGGTAIVLEFSKPVVPGFRQVFRGSAPGSPASTARTGICRRRSGASRLRTSWPVFSSRRDLRTWATGT